MNIFKLTLRPFILLLCLGAPFCLAETAVVVHPSNGAALDKNSVKKIFLGKMKSYPGGSSAVPLNKKGGDGSLETFNQQILGKSSSQIKSYWSKLVFTGKGTPPKEIDTDDEIKNLVSTNPSIIGYIDASLVDDSVKVVFTF